VGESSSFKLAHSRIGISSFRAAKRPASSAQLFARYRVTLDFPGEQIFLAKGKHFADHDRGSMCGAHLVFKKSGIVVDSVEEKSPASVAGVRAKDVLVACLESP